jgi:hypothetical protein
MHGRQFIVILSFSYFLIIAEEMVDIFGNNRV